MHSFWSQLRWFSLDFPPDIVQIWEQGEFRIEMPEISILQRSEVVILLSSCAALSSMAWAVLVLHSLLLCPSAKPCPHLTACPSTSRCTKKKKKSRTKKCVCVILHQLPKCTAHYRSTDGSACPVALCRLHVPGMLWAGRHSCCVVAPLNCQAHWYSDVSHVIASSHLPGQNEDLSSPWPVPSSRCSGRSMRKNPNLFPRRLYWSWQPNVNSQALLVSLYMYLAMLTVARTAGFSLLGLKMF